MTDENKYYSPVPIIEYAESISCPVIGIAGGKGNGKTFGLLFYYLKERIRTGRILRYLRRYRESIAPKAIQSLCKPQRQNLINLTNGQYNDFQYYQNRFFLVRRNENGDIVEKDIQPFIVCSALNSVEGFTGADEGECSAVFYDEFLSREKELPDEFYSLMIFHNNCIRNRTDYFCPLILVGNTVTRNSSLIVNFGVDLYSMKKGEITVVKNSRKEPTIVFEYCTDAPVMKEAADTYYSRFENDRIKMIYKGDWTVSNYPMLPRQELDSSFLLANIKIISPSGSALLFSFRRTGDNLFGYVSTFGDDDTPHICTMINKTYIFKKPNYINYLPNKGIFRTFAKLIYTKNVYFESMEIGEYFRDFLKNLTGASQLISVYK
ncbi:MAG: phage DNA encapsidation protein [Bacteroidaceae bacterium]|nr:phage DNA encapsidation protein [Bacteroidaceae bacterium]